MIGSGLALFERSEFSQTPISPSTARKPEGPTQQGRQVCILPRSLPGDYKNQSAGSRISHRTLSIDVSNSGDNVVPQASRHSSSCATDVTPMMVLATRQLV